MNRNALLLVTLALVFSVGCTQETNSSEETSSHAHSHDHDHAHGHDHGDHSHDAAHEHVHDHTPHHGIVVPFSADGTKAGYLELKLHDDKGDLELWLTADEAGKNAFPLGLDSVITVSFPELAQKQVELRIRNSERNEDEDDVANIKDGKTHYFIFPGDTGVDASFLVGKDFASNVVVSFADGDTAYATEVFKLIPHVH